MILDHISYIHQYIGLCPSLKYVMPFLERVEKESLQPGTYELDGRKVYAVLQEYETKPESTCQWECHRKYIDVQMLLEGEEEIGWTEIDSLTECEEYDEERDIMMAADAKHASMLVLSAKQFAIFTPHDAHKPLCLHKVPGNVKKVVFKIAV